MPVPIEKIAVLRATPRAAGCARHRARCSSRAYVLGAQLGALRSADASPRRRRGPSGPRPLRARAAVALLSARQAARRLPAAGGSPGSDKAAIVRRSAARPRSLRARRLSAMANIHSQKKRILRSERERLENRRYTSTIKTYFRRLESRGRGGEQTTAATRRTGSSSARSTRPSSAARCTGTPARARSPALRARAALASS